MQEPTRLTISAATRSAAPWCISRTTWAIPAGPRPTRFWARTRPRARIGGQPFLFKPLGGGCQDIPGLVEAAREAGTRWLVVEQDESPERPALEDARLSAEHLLPLL